MLELKKTHQLMKSKVCQHKTRTVNKMLDD